MEELINVFWVWTTTPLGAIIAWTATCLGLVAIGWGAFRRILKWRHNQKIASRSRWILRRPRDLRPQHFDILSFSKSPRIDLRDGWSTLDEFTGNFSIILLVARSGNGKSQALYENLKKLPPNWAIMQVPFGATAAEAGNALAKVRHSRVVTEICFVMDDLNVYLSEGPDLDVLWSELKRSSNAQGMKPHLLMTLQQEQDQILNDPNSPAVVHQAHKIQLRLLTLAEGRFLSGSKFSRKTFDGTPASLIGANGTRKALLRMKNTPTRRVYFLVQRFDNVGVHHVPIGALEVVYEHIWSEVPPMKESLRNLRTFLQTEIHWEQETISGPAYELNDYTKDFDQEYGQIMAREIADALIADGRFGNTAHQIAQASAFHTDRETSIHIWNALLPDVPARYSHAYTSLAIHLMNSNNGWTRAEQILEAGHAEHPRDTGLAAKYSELLLRTNRPAHAEQILEGVVDSHPSDKLALSWYIEAFLERLIQNERTNHRSDETQRMQFLLSLKKRSSGLNGVYDSFVGDILNAIIDEDWATSEDLVINYLKNSEAIRRGRTTRLAATLVRIIILFSPIPDAGINAARFLHERVDSSCVTPLLDISKKISHQRGRKPAIKAYYLILEFLDDVENNASCYTDLNWLARRLGDWCAAVEWGSKASSANSDHPINLLGLAEALYGMARHKTSDPEQKRSLIDKSDEYVTTAAGFLRHATISERIRFARRLTFLTTHQRISPEGASAATITLDCRIDGGKSSSEINNV